MATKEMSTREYEQRTKVLLVDIANTKRNIDNAKATAENPDRTPAQRAQSKKFYNEQTKKLADLQKQLDDFRATKEKAATEVKAGNLRKEVADLQERYDLKLDKNSPEAVRLKRDLTTKQNELKKIAPEVKPTAVPAGAPEVRQGRVVEQPAQKPTVTKEPTKPEKPKADVTEEAPPKVEEEKPPKKDGKGQTFEQVLQDAKGLYGGIDEVFRTDKELRDLLVKAVGKAGDPTDNYTPERFLSELENTNWWKTNAGAIRKRGFYKRQYDNLVSQIKSDDPNYQTRIDELNRTSEYGRGLQNTIETLQEEATKLGRTIDETALRTIAANLYDYANEGDAVKIRNAVLGSGKWGAGGILTGEAGKNLQDLKAVAAANGLDLDVDFGTSKDTWLDRISKGESIETFKNLIRNSAKTAWQLDDRTSALLDQGVDLSTIYSPFKKQMSVTLEIPEEEITIKDLLNKGVIGGEKPKTLYDFKKELRKDDRWQYTENARAEVSNFTENLLRDFGFVR